MPSNWLVFDRIRALTRQHRIYRFERLFQDQSNLDKLTAGGDFLDTNTQSAILDQTNLQINRMERYRDYEQMDQTGEISLALDLYCLSGDTRIPLLDGTCPTIAELAERGPEATFWLYGYDVDTKLPKPVLGRNPHVSGRNAEMVRVNWDGGHIDCTPSHKFSTKRGWVPAGELILADELNQIIKSIGIVAAHRHNTVTSIVQLPGIVDNVYDLYVDDGHCFAAGTNDNWVIVHNSDEACLSGETRIPLLDGTYPTVAELAEKGSEAIFEVHAYDLKIHRYVKAIAHSARITGTNADTVNVRLNDGMVIRCTSNHLFMLDSGVYVEAGKLKPGNSLKTYIPANEINYLIPHTVVSVTDGGIIDKVYDIEVPDYHCFAAGSDKSWVIVHNSLVDPERKHTLLIRARNRRLKRELEELFYDVLQWDTYCRPSVRYLCKYGDMPFEVVLDNKRSSVSSLKFMNVYNFTRVETRHGDLVGFYHMDTLAPKPTFLHPWQVIHLRLTSFENGFHPYGRCCDIDSDVDTPTGTVKLRDIKPGDDVMSWTGSKSIRDKVLAVASSGVKSTLLIKTAYRSVRVTPEHPLFTVKRLFKANPIKSWKLAKDLKVGDHLFVPRKYDTDPKASNFTDHYFFDPVIEIVDGGEIEVGDIQIMHNPSFICNGVVVHNSVIDGGRKAAKQLRLMEDAALVYRITRSPEKRKFTIPVGLIPPKEVPEYLQMVARGFKRQRFYNPASGTFDERYSPLIQEDDFFLPRRPDGTGPDVDVLPGGENVDKIADIEYFKKKMIAPTKIPFSRVGIGEGGGEASEKSLSQSHSEFAKAVQWVQREVATGLKKVAIIHLALRGYSVEDLRGFDIALTATSAMEELYRIETWQTRTGVMADLKDLGWFPKEWIVTHFTDLSPDEIEELKDMEVQASEGTGGGGGGGLDVDTPDPSAIDDPNAPPDPMAEASEMMDMQQESKIPGYDKAAEKRLLSEMRLNEKTNRESRRKGILNEWALRKGKDIDSEKIEFHSGYQHMLESKELDGLSMNQRNTRNYSIGGVEVNDPNNDQGLLVEWSVPVNERNTVLREVLDIISVGEAQEDSTSSTEITQDDLPS